MKLLENFLTSKDNTLKIFKHFKSIEQEEDISTVLVLFIFTFEKRF